MLNGLTEKLPNRYPDDISAASDSSNSNAERLRIEETDQWYTFCKVNKIAQFYPEYESIIRKEAYNSAWYQTHSISRYKAGKP